MRRPTPLLATNETGSVVSPPIPLGVVTQQPSSVLGE